MKQKFDGRSYETYDKACINDSGKLQCPKCGSYGKKQIIRVEIYQYGLVAGWDRSTTMVTCGKCAHDYAFQSWDDDSIKDVNYGIPSN